MDFRPSPNLFHQASSVSVPDCLHPNPFQAPFGLLLSLLPSPWSPSPSCQVPACPCHCWVASQWGLPLPPHGNITKCSKHGENKHFLQHEKGELDQRQCSAPLWTTSTSLRLSLALDCHGQPSSLGPVLFPLPPSSFVSSPALVHVISTATRTLSLFSLMDPG